MSRVTDEQIAEWRELVEYLARGSDPAVRLLKPALDALEAERARADEAESEAINALSGCTPDYDWAMRVAARDDLIRVLWASRRMWQARALEAERLALRKHDALVAEVLAFEKQGEELRAVWERGEKRREDWQAAVARVTELERRICSSCDHDGKGFA